MTKRTTPSIERAVGAEASVERVVSQAMTARAIGSGDVDVLATPEVLALVERAARAAIDPWLRPGTTTVGASVELTHLAPTPVGALVRASARVEAVEGRTVRFAWTVSDGAGEVARGRHNRVLVDRADFQGRADLRGGDASSS